MLDIGKWARLYYGAGSAFAPQFTFASDEMHRVYAGGHVTRLCVAGILTVAAVLKSMSFLSAGGSVSIPLRVAYVGLIAAELSLALWLASGWQPQMSSKVCAVSFFVFFQISLWNAIAGEQDCSCFGAMKVSPWATSSLDLVVFAAVLKFTPAFAMPVCSAGSNRLTTGGGWLWCLVPLAALAIAFVSLERLQPMKARVETTVVDDLLSIK